MSRPECHRAVRRNTRKKQREIAAADQILLSTCSFEIASEHLLIRNTKIMQHLPYLICTMSAHGTLPVIFGPHFNVALLRCGHPRACRSSGFLHILGLIFQSLDKRDGYVTHAKIVQWDIASLELL